MKRKKPGPKGPHKYTPEFIEKEADALKEYFESTAIPFFKDFCSKRGYPSQYVSDVFLRNEKFARVHAMMKDIQESKLFYGSLTNKINYKFAIFALKNVAGWRDVKDHKHEGNVTFAAIMKAVSENGNGNGSRIPSAVGSRN